MTNNLRNNRIRALVIGASLGLALIAFVYAFIQNAEAKRMAQLALECERISMENEKQLIRANEQLKKVAEMANDQIRVAEKKLVVAQQQAEQAATKSKNKK